MDDSGGHYVIVQRALNGISLEHLQTQRVASRINQGTSVDNDININMDLMMREGGTPPGQVRTTKFSRASRDRGDSVQMRRNSMGTGQGSPGTTYKQPPSRQQKSGMSRTFDELRNIHAQIQSEKKMGKMRVNRRPDPKLVPERCRSSEMNVRSAGSN